MPVKANLNLPAVPPEERRALIYVRVSDRHGRGTKAGGREFYSPGIQHEEGLKHFAALGIPVDEELSIACRDISESAFDRPWDARPGMRRAVVAAQDGHVTDIYCFLKSRLGRDTLESLTLLKILQHSKVTVWFGDGHRDLDNPDDELFLTMELAFAKHESAKKRAFGIKAARKRVLQQKPHGKPPSWIEKDQKTGALVVNETHAALPKRIVELRIQTLLGATKISQQLARENRRGANGGKIMSGNVLRFLGEHYIALMRGTHIYKGAGFDEEVRIPNAWPPIITEEQEAQLRHVASLMRPGRNGNAAAWKSRGKSADTTFLASGLIYCYLCGSHLTTFDGSHNGRAYVCLPGRTNEEKHGMQGLSIRAGQVDDAVKRAVLYALSFPPPPPPKTVPPPRSRKTAPSRTPDMVTHELDALLALHLSGKLPTADYERNAERLIAERAALADAAQKEAAPPPRFCEAQAAAATDNWRLAVLQSVARVEAPILRNDVVRRNCSKMENAPKKTARRVARITFHWDTPMGRTIDAPLYRPDWEGERILLSATDDIITDWRLHTRGVEKKPIE